MIFLHKPRLALLSTTKTGSTSLERVLGKRASIAVRFPPKLKHMTYRRFMKDIHPLIEHGCGYERTDYEVVTVMREPVSWLQSWYRYRRRPSANRSTGDMSYEEFILDYLKAKPPAYAAVGNQLGMYKMGKAIGVDRIFPYESFDKFEAWLSERIGEEISLPKANISEKEPIELTSDTEKKLKKAVALPIAFHALLNEDGSLTDKHRELIRNRVV